MSERDRETAGEVKRQRDRETEIERDGERQKEREGREGKERESDSMQRQLDMQPGKTTLPPHTFPPPRRQDQTGVLLHQRLNSHDCNGDYTVNAPMQL